MKTINHALKTAFVALKLEAISKKVMSLLAVVLLLTIAACNGVDTQGKVNAPTSDANMPTTGKITELYKPIAPPEGGMNNYSDVDPRMDTSEANAKAQRQIDRARDRGQNNTNPVNQLRKDLDNKGMGERAKDFASDAAQAAKQNADDFAKGTARGFENLKQNTKNLKDDVETAAENTGRDIRNKASDNM